VPDVRHHGPKKQVPNGEEITMTDIRERIREVLEKGYLISLGTVDDSGVWVADVIYVFDNELSIYWMSIPQSRHSLAIEKKNTIAGTITVSQTPGEKDFGIQLRGVAVKLGITVKLAIAIKYLNKTNGFSVTQIRKALKDGYKWYVLRPEFIELIDQAHFGYNKQRVDFLGRVIQGQGRHFSQVSTPRSAWIKINSKLQ
jgi:uncharacterized protein YhbP (UPF0306 family)